MSATGTDFGDELRRARQESGMSLIRLAERVHISKSYLSKIERGAATPSDRIARALDAKLSAHGRLAALLVPRVRQNGDAPAAGFGPGGWSFRLLADGAADFTAGDVDSPGARNPLDRSAPAVVAQCAVAPAFHQGVPAGESLPVFQALFHEYRRLGQFSGPAVVIPMSTAATAVLRGLGRSASTAERGTALRLAARYAEYTGWMWQEAGDDRAAACWTDQAVHLAEAGGDRELTAYALLRQAELALYRGDAWATVELARAAGSRARHGRTRELAAQREAQGHALLGDEDACRRALDRGHQRAQEALAQADGVPALGGTHLPDLTAFVTAWCLRELGEPEQAVDLLDASRDTIAPHAARARARHGARLALALTDAGDVERACLMAESVARDVLVTDSATVRSDVRQLRSALTRRSKHPGVRDVLPVVAESLRGGVGSGSGTGTGTGVGPKGDAGTMPGSGAESGCSGGPQGG
ncbi:helix-turn-helix domain-containing protein [Streptomyces sediminimaris]|uniref:helix-turn-helix domain-containing protein n=1 Tax=Streptomyces sediminimaris TaxID=3383721 RepID=UPI00399C2C6D